MTCVLDAYHLFWLLQLNRVSIINAVIQFPISFVFTQSDYYNAQSLHILSRRSTLEAKLNRVTFKA